MKRITLLKTLTTILLVFAGICMFFAVPFILLVAVMPGSVPVKINGHAATDVHAEGVLFMLAIAIGCAFFIYALYLFRKVLELFEKKKFFHDDVIKNFNQTGKAIFIGYAICAVATFLFNMLATGEISLELNTGFDSSLFIIGLGLFFIVLSDVFLMAKISKEENDLTV